jgi:threonine/homoserine/homoserine lactone efflux protein
MTIELWLAYVLTVAVLLVIPGPTILTVIGYSLAHGRRANVALVAGVALGDSTALALSLLGLGALLAASAWWFTAVKTVGGLYLVWLGVAHAARRRGAGRGGAAGGAGFAVAAVRQHLAGDGAQSQGHRLLRRLPAAVHHAGSAVAPQMWILAVTFVAMAIINAALYARFAAAAHHFLASARARRGFNIGGGSLLAGAGVWALLARRPV